MTDVDAKITSLKGRFTTLKQKLADVETQLHDKTTNKDLHKLSQIAKVQGTLKQEVTELEIQLRDATTNKDCNPLSDEMTLLLQIKRTQKVEQLFEPLIRNPELCYLRRTPD